MAVFTSAALGAGLFSLGSGLAATVSAIALNVAVGVGLSLAATALATGNQQESTGGVRGSIQAGGDVPRSFVLGRRATAGSLVYAGTWGSAGKTPNAYLVQVISLSDIPDKGLSTLYVSGEKCTVDFTAASPDGMGYPVTEYRTGGKDYLWIKFYDGTQTAADPYLVEKFGTHPTRPYAATRVGKGITYAVMTARVNPELFSGFPAFRFELKGARLYDISKDSTAGGVGAQRWANPATWGGDGDDLPIVQAYNILRGIRYSGTWLYGLQTVSAGQLPAAHWIGQIAKCRALVPGLDGNEAQYLTSAEITVDTEIRDTLDMLMTGCNGRLSETGGIYKPRVGDPGAPVFDIVDGDILSTEPQSYVPFFGLAETVNGISASYPEPEEGWNTKPAPSLYNAGYEAQDGNRRLMSDVPMEAVYRSSQVQRLMAAALAEARRARRLTYVLPPSAQVLEPGDVVRYTSARNGFSAKLFRVDGVTDRANLDVVVDITEVDPTDYDPPGTYRTPVFSPLGPVRPGPQIMGGWSVVASSADGRRPAILVSCDDDLDDISRVWVQVRLASSGALVFDSSSTTYAEPYSWLLTGAWCFSTTDYEVRGRYIPASSRPTEWGGWLPVTTGTFADSDFTATLETIGDDVRAVFADIVKTLTSDVISMIENLGIAQSLTSAGGQLAREQMLAEVGTARAEILEERYVRATETEALSASYLAVAAQVASAAAAIITEQTARVSADSALATSIQTVSAEYDGRFAQGLIKFEAAVAPSGVDARFAVLVRGGTSADYKVSGLYVDLYTVSGVQKSRVAVLTDQFVVTDGNDTSVPMVFESGQLKVNAARFGTVTSGVLQSPDGKMVINLAAGTIVVKS